MPQRCEIWIESDHPPQQCTGNVVGFDSGRRWVCEHHFTEDERRTAEEQYERWRFDHELEPKPNALVRTPETVIEVRPAQQKLPSVSLCEIWIESNHGRERCTFRAVTFDSHNRYVCEYHFSDEGRRAAEGQYERWRSDDRLGARPSVSQVAPKDSTKAKRARQTLPSVSFCEVWIGSNDRGHPCTNKVVGVDSMGLSLCYEHFRDDPRREMTVPRPKYLAKTKRTKEEPKTARPGTSRSVAKKLPLLAPPPERRLTGKADGDGGENRMPKLCEIWKGLDNHRCLSFAVGVDSYGLDVCYQHLRGEGRREAKEQYERWKADQETQSTIRARSPDPHQRPGTWPVVGILKCEYADIYILNHENGCDLVDLRYMSMEALAGTPRKWLITYRPMALPVLEPDRRTADRVLIDDKLNAQGEPCCPPPPPPKPWSVRAASAGLPGLGKRR